MTDVPVNTSQDLLVLTVAGEVGPRTGIVPIFLLQVVGHTLHVAGQGARYHTGSCLAILASTILDDLTWSLLFLVVDEEEELVLHNRTAQRESVGGL